MFSPLHSCVYIIRLRVWRHVPCREQKYPRVGQYCYLSDASGLPLGLWCLAVRGLLSQMNGEGGPRPCLVPPPHFFLFPQLASVQSTRLIQRTRRSIKVTSHFSSRNNIFKLSQTGVVRVGVG